MTTLTINTNTGTARQTIEDPKAFFEEIITPSYSDFVGSASSFRTAFNVATALFHMHEWLLTYKQPELEAHFSETYGSGKKAKSKFWQRVQADEPKAAYIRDLANASKHVKLTIMPSTGMTHIANTFIQSSSYGTGGYGIGRYSAASVMMQGSTGDVSLDDCVNALYAYWKNLIGLLYP
jgi:hypothetical protein